MNFVTFVLFCVAAEFCLFLESCTRWWSTQTLTGMAGIGVLLMVVR